MGYPINSIAIDYTLKQIFIHLLSLWVLIDYIYSMGVDYGLNKYYFCALKFDNQKFLKTLTSWEKN